MGHRRTSGGVSTMMIAGKNVLVTGGAGSVGRIVVSRLLAEEPNVVRVFDSSETGLSRMKHDLNDDRCRYLLGDVRDKDRLRRAFTDIDVVVHAAAIKNIDLSEYNPFEAVKTNIVGLQNVVDTAIDSSVERLVFTSSDKSTNPTNTMGATKLLGEKLVTAGNKYRGDRDLRLASIRFGNVVGSAQSVIPLFEKQIRNGGPVTLTDRRMTRFFLPHADLADAVISTVEHANGGEVFVPKMDAIRIVDLLEVLVDTLAPTYGHDPSEIDVELTGRRLGETFHEEVLTEREAGRTVENDRLYAILPEKNDQHEHLDYDGIEGFTPVAEFVRSSKHADYLDRAAIIDLLDRHGVLEATA